MLLWWKLPIKDKSLGRNGVVEAGDRLLEYLMDQQPSADHLLHRYARSLYRRMGSYKAVGDVMGVDQRTAKKYVG